MLNLSQIIHLPFPLTWNLEKARSEKLEMGPGVSHSIQDLSGFVTANISKKKKKKNNTKRIVLCHA